MRDVVETGRTRAEHACRAPNSARTGGSGASTAPWEKSKTQTLGELLNLLRDGVAAGAQVGQLLRLLARAVEARSAALALGPDPSSCYRCFNVPQEWIEIYGAHAAELDPLLPILDPAQPMSSRPGRWHSVRSLVTLKELKRAGVWQVARTVGIGDVAAVNLFNPFSDSVYIAVFGADHRGPFDSDALSLLDLLSPHIASALASRRALAAIVEPASEQLPEALARADGYAVLHPSSGHAELCLRARTLLQKKLGHLSAADWARVEKMLLAAAHRFCCWPLSLSTRSQRLTAGLRVELVFTASAENGQTLTALLLNEPQEADGPGAPQEELLTPRQRQVARAAVTGTTIAEIASDLGIHLETARTHLKKAYRQLGVSNRSELATCLDPGERP